MEKLISEFSSGLFFWQTLIFVTLIFLLRKFAWKPILDTINEREKSIRDSLNQIDLGDINVKRFGKDGDFLIKVEQKNTSDNDLISNLKKNLSDNLVNEVD